jgi:hypothetical protein
MHIFLFTLQKRESDSKTFESQGNIMHCRFHHLGDRTHPNGYYQTSPTITQDPAKPLIHKTNANPAHSCGVSVMLKPLHWIDRSRKAPANAEAFD